MNAADQCRINAAEATKRQNLPAALENLYLLIKAEAMVHSHYADRSYSHVIPTYLEGSSVEYLADQARHDGFSVSFLTMVDGEKKIHLAW